MSACFVAALLPIQSSTGVPLDVQLPAFLKALSFDRTLPASDGELAIGVVFTPGDENSESTKDRLLEIHRELTRIRVKGQRVRLVPIPYDPGSSLGTAGVKVVLVAPLSASAIDGLARQSGSADVLTLATDAAYVDRGLAMGMEMDAGRPRFVVNLAAAVEAGAAFESSFLNLCRIVER
jgi:hypothetical protein